MSDQQQPAPQVQAIDPKSVVIPSAMTAGDCLVMGCRSDVKMLAGVATTPPDGLFTLDINLRLVFKGSDAHAVLREAGMEITQAANEGASDGKNHS